MDKKNWGGNRKNAGRPPLPEDQKKEKTKTVRIPLSKLERVREIIKEP